MLEFIGYLWLFTVYGWLNGFFAIKLYHWNNRRKDVKFLRHLRIKHPDSVITLSSVESSDSKALQNLKEKLDEV